jgi:hypothetical protein
MSYFEIFFNLKHVISQLEHKTAELIMAIQPDMLPRYSEFNFEIPMTLLSNPNMRFSNHGVLSGGDFEGVRNTNGFFRNSSQDLPKFKM